MTVVVGLQLGGTTVIGSDGACTWSGTTTVPNAPKVRTWQSGTIIGSSGSGRVGHLLQVMPEPPADDVETLWQAVRQALESDGVVWSLNEGESCGAKGCGSSFVALVAGGLWEIDGAGGCRKAQTGWPVGIGSGSVEACAALDAFRLSGSAMPAEDQVKIALDVAKLRDPHCGGMSFLAEYREGVPGVRSMWLP